MKKVLSLAIALVFAVVGFAQDATPNPNAPEFKFEAEVHDFGTLDEGPKVTHEFTFKNVGKEPLIITSARASCGCTVPEKPEGPVLPGEEGKITVTYNTKGRIGTFNKGITITSNAKKATKVIYIKGTVKKAPAPESGTPEKPAEGPSAE